MARVVLIDGQSVPADKACISVYDRGFLYGDSVFETIRTYAGKLFALEEHLNRLADSAEKMGFSLPVSQEVLAQETRRGVAQAQHRQCRQQPQIHQAEPGPAGLGLRQGFSF